MVASFLALVAIASAMFWGEYLGETLPSGANPAAGRMYRLGYHGKDVYLTISEYRLFRGLFVFGAVSAVVGILAYRHAEAPPRR
jgi:hypothetical protein